MSASVEKITLNLYDVVIHVPGVIFSFINLIVCLTFIKLVVLYERKRFHLNFCILRFQLNIAYALITVPHGFISIAILLENTPMPIKYGGLYQRSIIISNLGIDYLRCLWIAIFIERTIATVRHTVYEKRKFLIVSITLSMLSIASSAFINYCRFILAHDVSGLIIQGPVLLIDLIGLLISENIRVMKLILPSLKLSVPLETFGTISFAIPLSNVSLFWMMRFSAPFYSLLFDIYIFIANILWIKNEPFYKNKILKIFNRQQRFNSRIAPAIYNVEGEAIPTNETPEFHFAALEKLWA